MANIARNFEGTMENLTDWTEIYVSAWMSDICQNDVYTTGSYCVGSRPEANGNGNCCTWYGKQMVVGAIGVREDNGAAVGIKGGFRSQISDGVSTVGLFFCQDQEFGTRRSRYSYQNIDFTSRIFRDGTIECWAGHNIARQGLPTRPPDKRVVTGIALGPDLQHAYVQKGAGWAEGGALAKDVAVVVKTVTHWETGRTCVNATAQVA